MILFTKKRELYSINASLDCITNSNLSWKTTHMMSGNSVIMTSASIQEELYLDKLSNFKEIVDVECHTLIDNLLPNAEERTALGFGDSAGQQKLCRELTDCVVYKTIIQAAHPVCSLQQVRTNKCPQLLSLSGVCPSTVNYPCAPEEKIDVMVNITNAPCISDNTIIPCYTDKSMSCLNPAPTPPDASLSEYIYISD